ncbi:hypothetical protein KIPB_008086, partial [Kipferlia bialata]
AAYDATTSVLEQAYCVVHNLAHLEDILTGCTASPEFSPPSTHPTQVRLFPDEPTADVKPEGEGETESTEEEQCDGPDWEAEQLRLRHIECVRRLFSHALTLVTFKAVAGIVCPALSGVSVSRAMLSDPPSPEDTANDFLEGVTVTLQETVATQMWEAVMRASKDISALHNPRVPIQPDTFRTKSHQVIGMLFEMYTALPRHMGRDGEKRGERGDASERDEAQRVMPGSHALAGELLSLVVRSVVSDSVASMTTGTPGHQFSLSLSPSLYTLNTGSAPVKQDITSLSLSLSLYTLIQALPLSSRISVLSLSLSLSLSLYTLNTGSAPVKQDISGVAPDQACLYADIVQV